MKTIMTSLALLTTSLLPAAVFAQFQPITIEQLQAQQNQQMQQMQQQQQFQQQQQQIRLQQFQQQVQQQQQQFHQQMQQRTTTQCRPWGNSVICDSQTQ